MDQTQLATRKNGEYQLALRQEQESALREMIVGGRKFTPEQVKGRLAFAIQQDLDPISEVQTLIDRDGKTMAHTMGINGLRRKNQEALGNPTETIDLEFCELPKEKMQADWLYAYECRLRDSVSYRNWQKRILEVCKTLKEVMGQLDYPTIIAACGPAPIALGVGVFYKSELSELKDKNFNPVERCKKRAEVNARHHRFPTSAPVYDGNAGGMVIDGQYKDATEPTAEAATEAPAPKRSEAKLMSDLGYDPDPEPIPSLAQAAAEEGGEVIEPPEPPSEVMSAMLIRFADKRLGDMTPDELTALINDEKKAQSLRNFAVLVRDWITR